MLQQDTKNLKRLAAELQLHSRLAQFAGTQISLEIPKSQQSKPAFHICHR
jgi:hypothetical protein